MARLVREYTLKILEAMDEGILDAETVVRAALQFMSEAEVQAMCEANDFFPMDDEDDE